MFDGRWRGAVDRKTGPVGQRLHRYGVTADVLTATGLVSATATAVAVGTGHLHLAIGLLILTGLHDLLDGPVAKASGTTSLRGAFFDSVTDRVADALILGGVAWYLVSTHPGHLVLLPFAVLGATSLVSYQRAKAESLGLSAKGGLMERAERMILLGYRLPVADVPGTGPVGHAGPDHGHRRRTVRQGLAPGRGPGPGGHRPGAIAASAGSPDRVVGRRRRHPSRWRARRQGELSSRSGRTWRARHARQGIRQRTGRRHT